MIIVCEGLIGASKSTNSLALVDKGTCDFLFTRTSKRKSIS